MALGLRSPYWNKQCKAQEFSCWSNHSRWRSPILDLKPGDEEADTNLVRFIFKKARNNLATIMSDQGFWVCQIKESSTRLVDSHLGGLRNNHSMLIKYGWRKVGEGCSTS